MEEYTLPSIPEMYKSLKENHDYSVQRKYAGLKKNFSNNPKPTKKTNYLDDSIRQSSSPGPANTANIQPVWIKKQSFQTKRSQKKTFIDQITRIQKKNMIPSPNKYDVSPSWPKKQNRVKNVGQKSIFTDTCQYQSTFVPGPGSYNVRTKIASPVSNKARWVPHVPLKVQQNKAADMTTYNPVPAQYDTFDRIKIRKQSSQPSIQIKHNNITDDKKKENKQPGPTKYSNINFWKGKQKLKTQQYNYLGNLSYGPIPSVYYH